MNVLIGCEMSAVVREEFRKRGHNAWSCDLEPSEIPGNHYQCDILEVMKMGFHWDLFIGHPPCTYLCNSGVQWLHTRPGRWEKMIEAANFFKTLMNFPAESVALENPIPHKYALEIIGRKYDQLIQPWQFGHGETKATCLWLKNLPKLKHFAHTDLFNEQTHVAGREQRVFRMTPGPDRAKERSRTYTGIAEQMAEQWG